LRTKVQRVHLNAILKSSGKGCDISAICWLHGQNDHSSPESICRNWACLWWQIGCLLAFAAIFV
jgi:hypothetical protein